MLLYNGIVSGIVPLQCLFVGRPPHHDDFLYGKIKIILVMLSYHCQFSGGVFDADRTQLFSVQIDSTLIRFQSPVNALEKR